MSERTLNGFRMGAAEVMAVADIKGYAVLWVQTAHKRIEIQVSPQGRKIKVLQNLEPVLFGDEP